MKHYNGESRRRAIAKGVTWRLIASGTTMALVYFVTGSLETMATVGMAEMTLKFLFYYGHERIWGIVPWGVEPIHKLARR
jgi:adenylylsulfate kinase